MKKATHIKPKTKDLITPKGKIKMPKPQAIFLKKGKNCKDH